MSSSQKYNRINVVGTSGSGKSTFSKRLAQILEYPYIEIDKIFWEPNWKSPTDEKFFSNLKKSLNRDQWVLDGNYTRSIFIKWEKVDLVIWLDYSFTRTFYQVLKRSLRRAYTQEEIWEGTANRESFKKSFLSKDSIIWWMLTTYKSVKIKYQEFLINPDYSHIKFIRLKSPKEAEKYLMSLK